MSTKIRSLFKNRQSVLLVLILILSIFLRFYRIEDLYVFGIDEEYQASLAKTIIDNFHIIWVGVSVSIGFYLGPAWTYLTAFLLFLSRGTPLITAYFASTLGVLTTFAVYYTGKEMFNQKVGIMTALLYATLPLIVYFDRKYWNASPTPLLATLILLSLFKIRKSPKWLVVLSASFALIFHTHLLLLFLIVPVVYTIFVNRKKIQPTILAISFGIAIAILSPLIVFDYFHKGSNITTPIRLIQSAEQNQLTPNLNKHAQAFFQTLGRMWYLKPYRTNADETNFGCTPVYASDRQSPRWQIVNATTQRTTPNSAVCAFSLLVLIWFLLKPITWKDPATKLLAISILAAIIFYLIFPGTYYEYYLLGFIPLFLFIPALLINKLAGIKKYGLLTPVLVFSLLGILTALTAKNDYGLKTKELLIKNVIAVIGKNRFEEEDYGMCHIAEGWRYLFCAYGKCPERAMVDKSLGWIYPTEITQSPVDYLVTIAESRIPPNFSTKDAVAITSGGFSAYIYKQ